MVGHQAISLANPIDPLHHPRQRAEEDVTVLIVLEDRLAAIAPRGDVIERTEKLNS